jgi:pyruvate dehydrogenase E2 component (dihydrolipoamide acetyltransferase)
MATKVHMEALSPTMEEGQLVSWLKAEGDEIAEGDILAEIETDKATMELVARGAGVLRKQLLAEGGTAPVGTVIGVIAGPDEDIAEIVDGAGAGKESAPGEDGGGEAKASEREAPEADEIEEAEADEAGADEVEADEVEADEVGTAADRPREKSVAADDGSRETAADGDRRVRASPLARRLAEEKGLDLGGIEGSGPGGRVIKRDIERAAEEDVAPAARPPAAAAPGGETVKVSPMRKANAKRLVQSCGPGPTVYLRIEVDAGRLLEAR